MENNPMNDYLKCPGYQLLKQEIAGHTELEFQKDTEQETIIMSINKRMDKLEGKIDEIPGTIRKVLSEILNELAGKFFKWIFIIGIGGGVLYAIKDTVASFLTGNPGL